MRTLARGLDILSLFAERGPVLSQSDIAAALGLPLPTVHRLTATLAGRGFLLREPGTRRLRLGFELTRLLAPLVAGLRGSDAASTYLRALADETGETVNLAVLDGAEIVYVTSHSGARVLTSQTPVGLSLPAHCTALGKCLLAQIDPDEARAALGPEPYAAPTPHTHATWAELGPDLDGIRRSRLSVSHEELEVGLVSLAVPLSSLYGDRPAAVNLSLPTSRATPAFREEVARRLRETARAIEDALGMAA